MALSAETAQGVVAPGWHERESNLDLAPEVWMLIIPSMTDQHIIVFKPDWCTKKYYIYIYI